MFEFNADSVLNGLFSFNKSKIPGEEAKNNIQLNLNLNYAYQLMHFPDWQIGGRFIYLKDTATAGDIENLGLQGGLIYNLDQDLKNSIYFSLYLGMLWNKEFGNSAGENEEVLISTLALGKRYSLKDWGVTHIIFSPEVAFQNSHATTGGDFSYEQNLEFRFLQFSLLF